MTEGWAARELFCPSCDGEGLSPFAANRPVADLFCPSCGEQFELKSGRDRIAPTLANGAFHTKIERILSKTAPNLLVLAYGSGTHRVLDLLAVPKRFFTRSIVSARKPLAPTARRAGWVGSTIRLDLVPNLGRIAIVEGGQVMRKEDVRRQWRRTAFADRLPVESRGWLADVMACVERAPEEFELTELYAFEDHLQTLHPGNSNVRPKIRQQLQVMRDHGLIAFLGDGRYRKLR